MKGNIIVISGPSAVGKSRVIKEVLQTDPNIKYIVSYTTRLPRKDEEEGRDYYFVSEEEFLHLIKTGQMLEWKKTNYGYYGTPGTLVNDYLLKGHTVLLDIDPQGYSYIKKLNISPVYGVYLLPESLPALYHQIVTRGSQRGIKSKQDADLRFQDSLNSISMAGNYDMILINESVLVTAKRIIQLNEILRLQEGSEDLLTQWNKANGLYDS